MVGDITLIPEEKVTLPILLPLLVVLILTLGGCGGGSSVDEAITSAESGGTAPASTSDEETTSTKIGGGGTVPADIMSATIVLSPSGGSGVSGVAILTDTPGGVEVTLNMRNLPDTPGAEHLAHIHEGATCADDRAGNGAPVQYPLGSTITRQDGTGSNTAVIPDTTVAQLFSGAPKYLNVHAETTDDELPPGVSCADLSTTTGGD
jgi:Cu/Zn superoxide dismutase